MAVGETVLLVPQGAEYQAVQRGSAQSGSNRREPLRGESLPWPIIPIAMGQSAIAQIKPLLARPPARAILLGLGGSLSLEHTPGEILVYKDCINEASGQRLVCDRALRVALLEALRSAEGIAAVETTGLTSDRVVCSAAEKQAFGERYGAAVVDMEGYPVLARLQQHGVKTGAVRVVSDGAEGNIPDVSQALGTDGSLRPLALAFALGREPIAALRLIRGSLRGLSVLQRVAAQLQESTKG